jgi:uncharacterized protein (DUF58 family)
MVVPQTRLLFWFAVVVLPFATLGGVYPQALPVALVFIAGLAVVAVLDAVLAYGSLAGVSVKLPEIVRLSKERPGTLEVQLKNARQQGRHLRVGLPLPREIQSPADELRVSLPAGSEWSRLEWACTPLRRGNYRLHRTHLECSSPLGFWAARAAVPVSSEIRVYPNLLTERRNLAALFLHRGAFGAHAQRQVGKGRDFEKLRDYIPGDSFDEIHWKATAKRGRPVTKVFQIERTQEVYVLIDTSRLSARLASSTPSAQSSTPGDPVSGTSTEPSEAPDAEPGTSVLERFITSALTLGLVAEQQGDLFGLLTFSDRVETFLRARNGQAHYDACRDALYTLEPRLVSPDFDEVATFIRLRLRRRALLVFLTALDDPLLAESFARNMDLICRQHLVLVNMLKPPGVRPLFANPAVASTDALYRELGGHLQWHKLRELEKVLRRRGVSLSLVDNEKMSAQLVTQYVGVKRRQLL